MTRYSVTYRHELEADSAEEAARETDRLLQTTRPKEFDVTPRGHASSVAKTVFVRVDRGEAKRIA